LASLVEGVKTVLLVTLVQRVIDDSASSTSTHLLERSIRGTTGASNESNDTDNDTSDDTSSEGSGDNESGRKSASFGILDALTLFFTAFHSAAVSSRRCNRIVAVQGLIIAALESNADSDGTEETVIGAREVLRDATASRRAVIALARVLEIAGDVVRCVHAITSGSLAGIISATNTIVAMFLSSLASTSLGVASRGNALVRRVASDIRVGASSGSAGVNGTGIAVVTIDRGRLAASSVVATRDKASTRGIASGRKSLAMVIGRRSANTKVRVAASILSSTIDCA